MAAALSEWPPLGPGLYFLLRNGAVVYVGCSDHPEARVFVHSRCRRKSFDLALYLPVSTPALLHTERYWIKTLCPVHNGVHNPLGSDDPWG